MSKCPHCGIGLSLREYNPKEYKRRKSANALSSVAKAKANGTKLGRKKIRNDAQIEGLRKMGYSIRDIAVRVGVSSATVWKSLQKDRSKADE